MMLAQYEKMAAGYDTKKGELLQQVAELTKINRELAGYLSKVLTKDTTVKLLHSLLQEQFLAGVREGAAGKSSGPQLDFVNTGTKSCA